MRSLGVVTGTRADFGLLLPLLRGILAHPDLALKLYVTAAHLDPAYGATEHLVTTAGIPVAARIPMLSPGDGPGDIARAMARGTAGFADLFDRERPDLLVLIGDRFEMLAAASAALPFNLPMAHLHGGEVTEGAMDESIRHALTKMAHLHFASHPLHAQRIRQLGEDPARIHVAGALALDNLLDLPLLDRSELERRFGFDLSEAPLLVTFHPVTRTPEASLAQLEEVLAALDASGCPLVVTLPNADTGGRALRSRLEAFVQGRARAWAVDTLGTQAYFSLMGFAAAMVGNSSSGLLEAPTFGLPVVNVGDRQKGRLRGANVLDVPPERTAILEAIRQATHPSFRVALAAAPPLYPPPGAATRTLLEVLASVPLEGLCQKPFHDLG